jgi:endonuclease YncB( thermonuclease family)
VLELRNIQRGKYFRIVAEVYVDGKSLTESLIAAGLGYRYHGGKKKAWC